MSYEILLFPRQPGQDWDEVLAADEADTPDEVLNSEDAMAEGVATFRRIESRLRRFLPGEAETWVAEETGGDVLGEYTDADTGLSVELYHGSAQVSFPYRPVDNLSGFHIKVREAARIVAEETGYEAYDAQTRASFDGTIRDEEGRAAALLNPTDDRVDGDDDLATDPADLAPPSGAPVVHPASGGPDDTVAAAEEPAELSPREKRLQAMMEARSDPKRVRRRAFFDLALAVLIAAWVLYRRNEGDTGFLTTVLMILGFMNLLAGVLGLRHAARLDREGAEGGAPEDGPGPTF